MVFSRSTSVFNSDKGKDLARFLIAPLICKFGIMPTSVSVLVSSVELLPTCFPTVNTLDASKFTRRIWIVFINDSFTPWEITEFIPESI